MGVSLVARLVSHRNNCGTAIDRSEKVSAVQGKAMSQHRKTMSSYCAPNLPKTHARIMNLSR